LISKVAGPLTKIPLLDKPVTEERKLWICAAVVEGEGLSPTIVKSELGRSRTLRASTPLLIDVASRFT